MAWGYPNVAGPELIYTFWSYPPLFRRSYADFVFRLVRGKAASLESSEAQLSETNVWKQMETKSPPKMNRSMPAYDTLIPPSRAVLALFCFELLDPTFYILYFVYMPRLFPVIGKCGDKDYLLLTFRFFVRCVKYTESVWRDNII